MEPLSGPCSPMATPGSRLAGRGGLAAEVETEIEDEGEEVEEAASPSSRIDGTRHEEQRCCAEADEVEEELESTADADDVPMEDDLREESIASGSAPSQASGPRRGGDYAVPAANKQVWKQFGCNTEAGRALRKLYSSGAQSDAASLVSYPRLGSPAQRWEPKPAPRKPCPQRAPVRVPRAGGPKYDPDDPRHWRAPPPGRKPANQILAEMEADQPQAPHLPEGRNQGAAKQHLQERFQFCGGRAMPRGAMGHVEPCRDLPEPVESIRGRLEERRRRDDNGMNAEQRDIFEELVLAIKRKQERLQEIDEANTAEGAKPSKVRTARNKEVLELQNDIDRDLVAIDKLMSLADQ